MWWVFAFIVLLALWQGLLKYIAPRLYLVCGHSMLYTLEEDQVVMGFKLMPGEPLKDGRIYGYILPGDDKYWVIKRLAYHEEDRCFFIGDNADNSVDSRDYGLVDRNRIKFVVYWYYGMTREE